MNSIFWAAVSGIRVVHPGTGCRDVGVYPMGSSDNSIFGFRELIRLREVLNSLISTLLALFLIDQRAAIVELDFLPVPILFPFVFRTRLACLRRAGVCVLALHHMTRAAGLAGSALLCNGFFYLIFFGSLLSDIS